MVVDVFVNQNLVICGEKWFILNYGDEYICLIGIIWLVDILLVNEIVFIKIVNVWIQYSGIGSFVCLQEKGWLIKFFFFEWWLM